MPQSEAHAARLAVLQRLLDRIDNPLGHELGVVQRRRLDAQIHAPPCPLGGQFDPEFFKLLGQNGRRATVRCSMGVRREDNKFAGFNLRYPLAHLFQD